MKSRVITTALHELGEVLFPSNIYCMLCGKLIDSSRLYSLCDECVKKMHWITGTDVEGKLQGICEKCGKAIPGGAHRLCFDCMNHSHMFEKGFSCLTYGLHERELLMKLKYSGHGYLGRTFGDILFDRMECELDHLGIDLVIPVPISQGRLRKRGYNQSAVMANQFMRRWKEAVHCGRDCAEKRPLKMAVPEYDEHILFRKKETAMLRSMNPAERSLAMRGAFAVKAGTEERIAGKTILLIEIIRSTSILAEMYIFQGFADTLRWISAVSKGFFATRAFLRPGVP